MASSSSSSSSSLSTVTQNPQTQSLPPIHHLITIKLTRDNYLLWRAQILPYLKGQHLFGYIDGSISPPPQFLSPTTDNPQPETNPSFLTWQSQDQLILSALISSLSENILAYVVKRPTSRDVWTTLERMFTAQSRAKSMHIHYQLATLHKGDSSVADYYHQFTNLIDTLAAIDQPVPHHEQLSFLLVGLGSEFNFLVTSVKTQFHPVPLEDIYGHLLSHELRLSHNQPSVDLSNASANFVHKGTSNQSGRGRSSSNFHSNRGRPNWNNQRGRGRGRSNFSNTSNRPVCQVCHKIGHVALQCYHRFNNSYTMDTTPQMQALLATQQQVVDPNWYPDSGATHHLTHDLANLNVRADEYSGSE